jgi:hypothetical protein
MNTRLSISLLPGESALVRYPDRASNRLTPRASFHLFLVLLIAQPLIGVPQPMEWCDTKS